jgi:hypothetical protein
MTGFIAFTFLYPNRVSSYEAFEALEPDDGKLSRPVLRGPGSSNGVRLLDPARVFPSLRSEVVPQLIEAPKLKGGLCLVAALVLANRKFQPVMFLTVYGDQPVRA